MPSGSPDELARRARDGEAGAFDELVRATSAECFALAFRLTGNEADAADVVQEAYLRAFRAIGRFRAESSVRTWLYRIVANAASTSRRRRPAPAAPIDEALDLVDSRADRDPGAVAERHEERTLVVAALADLPFALRAVVVLRDIYDLPHEAIAAELGISRAAAKVRLHRARKVLRDALATPERDGATARGTGEAIVARLGRAATAAGEAATGEADRARAV